MVDTAHQLRIKDISAVDNVVVTCSSEGLILAWDLSKLVKGEEAVLARYEAKCRLTCLQVVRAVKSVTRVKETGVVYPESDYEDVVKSNIKGASTISVSFDGQATTKVVKKVKKVTNIFAAKTRTTDKVKVFKKSKKPKTA